MPFRKDHLHPLVRAALRTRSFDDMDFDAEAVQLPAVDDSDVHFRLLSVVICPTCESRLPRGSTSSTRMWASGKRGHSGVAGRNSHERGCLNLNCLESVSIVAGKNLNTILGQRSNKLHEGGTSSNCLLNVAKPEFCKFTMLSPEQKAMLLGDSLCRDASRCKQDIVVAQGSDEPLSYASMSHNLLILGLTLRWQT